MKKLIAAALAIAAATSVASVAGAQPMHHGPMVTHHGPMVMHHHRHQVRECGYHNHHRVCRMVWR